MNQPNDGGPAFPQTIDDIEGMSLRDWFAGKCLTGLMANYDAQERICNTDPRYQKQEDGEYNFSAVIAMNCYEFADAMLAERSKAPNQQDQQ